MSQHDVFLASYGKCEHLQVCNHLSIAGVLPCDANSRNTSRPVFSRFDAKAGSAFGQHVAWCSPMQACLLSGHYGIADAPQLIIMGLHFRGRHIGQYVELQGWGRA